MDNVSFALLECISGVMDVNKELWKKLLHIAVWSFLLYCLFSNISVLNDKLQRFVFGNNNTVMVEKYSPNGRYKAVKFQRDMGATTSANYQLSIISADDELENDVGNVFGTETEFSFEWLDNGTLVIKDYSDADVFKKETSVKGVEILYQ